MRTFVGPAALALCGRRPSFIARGPGLGLAALASIVFVVRAGHLGHAYALTAHLAQGSTVDRAYVLGSDELYREWGYTALSRHRTEARFYVSASREFLTRRLSRSSLATLSLACS